MHSRSRKRCNKEKENKNLDINGVTSHTLSCVPGGVFGVEWRRAETEILQKNSVKI